MLPYSMIVHFLSLILGANFVFSNVAEKALNDWCLKTTGYEYILSGPLELKSMFTYRDKYIGIMIEQSNRDYSILYVTADDMKEGEWVRPQVKSLEGGGAIDVDSILTKYSSDEKNWDESALMNGLYLMANESAEHMIIGGSKNDYLVNRKDESILYKQENGAIRYSIIHHGEFGGYVINKDIYTPSEDYVIYDMLNVMNSSWHWMPTDSQQLKDTSQAYFIEKTDDHHTVRFVSRANRTADAPTRVKLLLDIPVGFVKSGVMYLFDPFYYCVYILSSPTMRFDRKLSDFNGEALQFDRKSIPFEEFFKCDTHGPDMSINPVFAEFAHRCDHTAQDEPPKADERPWGQHAMMVRSKWANEGRSNSLTDASTWGWTVTIVVIIAAVVLVIVVAIVVKNKRNKMGKSRSKDISWKKTSLSKASSKQGLNSSKLSSTSDRVKSLSKQSHKSSSATGQK